MIHTRMPYGLQQQRTAMSEERSRDVGVREGYCRRMNGSLTQWERMMI